MKQQQGQQQFTRPEKKDVKLTKQEKVYNMLQREKRRSESRKKTAA